VLDLEDDPVIIMIAEAILMKMGHKVKGRAGGRAGGKRGRGGEGERGTRVGGYTRLRHLRHFAAFVCGSVSNSRCGSACLPACLPAYLSVPACLSD
jgi:hypothetical protein